MKYKIIKDNNPKLRKKSEPVELPLTKEDEETLDFMLFYLKKSQDEKYAEKHHIRAGVGLAAPQLGILKRMFVIYYPKNENEYVIYQLVNPKIVGQSVKLAALANGEGCLSVDTNHDGLAHRHYSIQLQAYDHFSKQNIIINASGYDAIVLQHEYDHLDGILFYDRIDKQNPTQPKKDEVIIP